MNKRAVILVSLLSTFVWASSAYSADTDFSITVNPSLSLSVSSDNVGFSITPSKNGVFNSDGFNVYASTNNTTGYTLTMSTNNVNLKSSTINVNTGDYPTIPTITETNDGISASAFEASTDPTILNHYGISIAGANFNAMKAEKEIATTSSNNVTQDTYAIALASKLDLNTVPGVYSTTINFQAVVNSVDPVQPYPDDPCDSDPNCDSTSGTTLQRAYELAYTAAHKGMWEEIAPGSNTFQYIDSWNGVNYQGQGRDVRFLIQDMTPSICNTATVIGSTALVLDVRDQTSYRIVKAADGRCWMQDNLALDPVANGSSLDPSNTNATQAAINNYLTSSGTASYAGWTTTAVSYSTNYSYTSPYVDKSSVTTVPQDSNDPLKTLAYNEKWKVGVYYNFCAASIGTYCYAGGSLVDKAGTAIDAEYDICPSGWRMPTGHNYDATNRPEGGEYQALVDAYPSIATGDNQYIRVRKALRLPLSGYFVGGSVRNQGSIGGFWSSTYYYSNDMYDLRLGADIRAQANDSTDGGFSVRCINKTGTEPAPSGN